MTLLSHEEDFSLSAATDNIALSDEAVAPGSDFPVMMDVARFDLGFGLASGKGESLSQDGIQTQGGKG